MRIIIATTAPLYWQPQAECFASVWRQAGHDAVAVNLQTLDAVRQTPADLLVCLGSGESVQPFLDANLAQRRILFLIESLPTLDATDDFTRGKLAAHRGSLAEFDHVFAHTTRSVATIRSLGVVGVEWLVWPHFPTIFSPTPQVERDLDVLFVGAMSPRREAILRTLSSRFKLALANSVFHADMAALCRRAKIVLNVHYTDASNFECRVIEALGCGSFLATERLEPDDVFRDGEHLAVFDRENLVDVLERYLADAEARRQIAARGHAEVQRFDVARQAARIVEVAAGLSATTRGTTETPAAPQESSAASPPPRFAGPINERTIHLDGRPFSLVFPQAHSIDDMLDELFVKKVYPRLPLATNVNGAILDVGANIGCTTILFRLLYPRSPVYALEPDPATFEYLRANTKALTDVRLFNFGAYNADATALLYQGRGTSTTNSISTSAHNSPASTPIRLRRLSALIAEEGIERISIVKIDTEGSEVPILQDLAPLFDRIDAVFVEYHSEQDRLEIDRILSERFTLFHAVVHMPHRGVLAYLAKRVLAAQTSFDAYAIPRP